MRDSVPPATPSCTATWSRHPLCCWMGPRRATCGREDCLNATLGALQRLQAALKFNTDIVEISWCLPT